MANPQNEVQDITRRLDNVNFPASKNDIINKVGNEQVTVKGRNMNLREVITKLPKDRYESKNQIQTDLQQLPEFRG